MAHLFANHKIPSRAKKGGFSLLLGVAWTISLMPSEAIANTPIPAPSVGGTLGTWQPTHAPTAWHPTSQFAASPNTNPGQQHLNNGKGSASTVG
jgi:hypothetical protein